MKRNGLEDNFKNLVSMDVQEKDGDLWFAASNRNGIYRIDGKTHEIIEKYRFEEEKNSEFMLYHDMEIYGKRIFLAPHKAEKIAVYDMDKRTMVYIGLKSVAEKYQNSYFSMQKFAHTFQDGEYVYMLGYTYPAIVKINVNTLEIIYIDKWAAEIAESPSKYISYGYFTMGNVKRNRKILLPMGCICGLLELDLDTGETRIIRLAISMEGIGGVTNDGNGGIWIVGRGKSVSKVVRWDIQKNECREIGIQIDEENCLVPFYAPLCYESKIFLFPVYMNFAYEISMVDGKYKISRILKAAIKERDKHNHLPMCTFSPRLLNGKIEFATGRDRMWHVYHLESGNIDDFHIVDDEGIEECVDESIRRAFGNSSKSVVAEGLYHLENYIDYVVSENRKRNAADEERVGNNIYYVTGELR
ncbi:MAG TPA: hypothetical protein DCZ40_02940 [Lachnospiraceae bacterium]|nr:hypothetical protein [Lachnospiraceae bacterium]